MAALRMPRRPGVHEQVREPEKARQGQAAVSHAEHRMHENSLAAYEAEAAKLGARARMIYLDIVARGAATDRQIRDRLGFKDMNAVRPRITELVGEGKLVETGNRIEDGRTVRIVDVVRDQQRRLF